MFRRRPRGVAPDCAFTDEARRVFATLSTDEDLVIESGRPSTIADVTWSRDRAAYVARLSPRLVDLSAGTQRVVAAHEIGHIALGHPVGGPVPRHLRRLDVALNRVWMIAGVGVLGGVTAAVVGEATRSSWAEVAGMILIAAGLATFVVSWQLEKMARVLCRQREHAADLYAASTHDRVLTEAVAHELEQCRRRRDRLLDNTTMATHPTFTARAQWLTARGQA